MSITKITTPELLDFPNDSTSSANTSGTIIPTGNNYVSGGGGIVENSLTLAVSTTYTVTVGTGGAGGGTTPTNGGDSTISGSFTGSPITATGGGSGNFSSNISNSGGSGAGAQGGDSSIPPGIPGNGIAGQGYRGGNAYPRISSDEAGGGGGGAGSVGDDAIPGTGGAGGIGIISYIKDAAGTKYAGGGGGGGRSVGGLAVSGYGGGDGSNTGGSSAGSGNNGQGGGGGSTGGNAAGTGSGDGGDGIIIIRYPAGITVNSFTGGGTTDNAISGSTDLYSEITSSGTIEFTGTLSSFTANYLVLAGGGGGGQDERGGAGAGGLRTSYGVTRPATADNGEFRYNEQYGYVEYYNGSNWQEIADKYITGQPTSCICNYPTQAVALYEFQDNTYNTCGGSAGVLKGTPTYVTGKFGKAINFNVSSNQAVDLPDNILPDNSTASSSASIWFKHAAWAPGLTTQCILDSWNYDTSEPAWSLFIEPAWMGNPDGHIYLANYYLGGSAITGSTAYDDGNWHHAVVVFDQSANKLKLYMDGALYGTETTTASNVWIFTQKAAIGWQNANPVAPRYYDGQIDQARIFSTALTETQITELYNEVPCN